MGSEVQPSSFFSGRWVSYLDHNGQCDCSTSYHELLRKENYNKPKYRYHYEIGKPTFFPEKINAELF